MHRDFLLMYRYLDRDQGAFHSRWVADDVYMYVTSNVMLLPKSPVSNIHLVARRYTSFAEKMESTQEKGWRFSEVEGI